MPPPIDEATGWQAIIGAAVTGAVALVIKWLFATRRDLRMDGAESLASHAYRETIEHQASRIEYLEQMLERRDQRIAALEVLANDACERRNCQLRMKEKGP